MDCGIEITGIGSDMQGVGRLPDGRAVFVPGAIPGETVNIQIERDKGRFCEASLCAVLAASEDRAAPACPHAGDCGGCQARHMRYARTLALKRQIVSDALSRIGGVDDPRVFETIGCAEPDRTRNKAEYPIGSLDGQPVIGAFAQGSHRVIPLDDCLLQQAESAAALRWFAAHLKQLPFARQLKALVTRVNRAGEMMLVLCGDAPILPAVERLCPALVEALPSVRSIWYCRQNRRPAHALDGRCERVWGAQTLTDTLLGLRFEIAPQAFFQVNAPQAEALYEKALEAAGLSEGCGKRVLDAYCGAGTITLAAARLAARATGIEIVAPAIENAKQNAIANGLSGRASFICGDAAREIPGLLAAGERFDAAILDPPRKGADEALLDALAAAKLPVIAYVSCNPATLARDVKRLAGHGYRLEWAQPVDMFPWTGHIETVVSLTHKG